MDPVTLASLFGGVSGIAKAFSPGGGGVSSSPGTSVQVSQNNSQNQSVNVGSNPYIPTLTGSNTGGLNDLYAALGLSTPAGQSLGDNRYTSSGNINQILMYVVIGLAAYYLISRF